MRFESSLAVAGLATLAAAQSRPANTSICDYYTTALLKNNSAANQYMLLTLVVNTAVIGNYTTPNVGIAVPGILTKGTYNGTAINLLPYFDGSLLSTNMGGSNGTSANFLDDGGAAPLMQSKPCNGNMSSNQCMLLIHLYEYFGVLLGCTGVGSSGFPSYAGDTSMYNVHKFMNLNPFQVGYFITQVGLSAASFGVATSDVQAVGMSLGTVFNHRCDPPMSIPPSAPASLQSICLTGNCPLAANGTCSMYAASYSPAFQNGSIYMAPGQNTTVSSNGSSSGSSGSGGSGGSSSSGSGGKTSGAWALFAPSAGIAALIMAAAAML